VKGYISYLDLTKVNDEEKQLQDWDTGGSDLIDTPYPTLDRTANLNTVSMYQKFAVGHGDRLVSRCQVRCSRPLKFNKNKRQNLTFLGLNQRLPGKVFLWMFLKSDLKKGFRFFCEKKLKKKSTNPLFKFVGTCNSHKLSPWCIDFHSDGLHFFSSSYV